MDIDVILDQLGFSHLKAAFNENKVTPKEVLSLTDTEFKSLGVSTIGDKVKIRAACAAAMSPDCAGMSPVVDRFHAFQSRRKTGAWKGVPQPAKVAKATKPTLRIYFGWKHAAVRDTFTMMTVSKGGGQQIRDVDRHLPLMELLEMVKGIYFPNGKNVASVKNEADHSFHLASFNGEELPTTINGAPFKLDMYCASLGYPIRVYLYSVRKDLLPDLDFISRRIPDVTFNTVQMIGSDISLSGDLLPDLDFVCSGTPEVTFRREAFQRIDIGPCDRPEIVQDIGQDIGPQIAPQIIPEILPEDVGPETLEMILQRLQTQLQVEERRNVVNVTREDVLDGARRGFSRSSFRDERRLTVRFSGEAGVDDGGPTREFMRLALKALRDSPIFEGADDAKMLAANIAAEAAGDFELAGRIMAYIIVHGGPAPQFLSETGFSCMMGKPNVDISDVSDVELRTTITKVTDAADEATFLAAVQPLEDIASYIGAGPLLRFGKKDQLTEALVLHAAYTRKMAAISQFTKGLSCLGLYGELQRHEEMMKPLFVRTHENLDAVGFELAFGTPSFSDEGSNRYRNELRTQLHWRDLLQDLEETNMLANLLVFATGLDAIPPLGIDPSPCLQFDHPEDDDNDYMRGVPFANTCANCLHIPVLPNYELFKSRMLLAIEVGVSFTDA